MKRLMNRSGVQRVIGDQCQFGLKPKDHEGIGPARKRTGFLTNAVCIARRLDKKCPNISKHQVHRHVALVNGRARAAQGYPDKLCREICLGIKEQIQRDRNGQYLLANVQVDNNTTSNEMMKVANEFTERYRTVEEEDDFEDEEAWGDVSGEPLELQEVKRARREEIEYVHKMKLYEKVLINEAYQQIGKGPISVWWVDITRVTRNARTTDPVCSLEKCTRARETTCSRLHHP